MRSTKTTRLLGAAVFVFLLLLGTGCTSNLVRPVEDLSDFKEEKSVLIAFSVSLSAPVELQQIELMVSGDRQAFRTAEKLSIDWKAGDKQVYLFSIPTDGARFGPVHFTFERLGWETIELGPVVTSTEKSLTYLGRIQASAFQMNIYEDSGRPYPAAVKIDFVDASIEDLPQLMAQYQIPATMPVVKAIPAAWAASEYAALVYRHPPRRYSNNRPHPAPVVVPTGRLGKN